MRLKFFLKEKEKVYTLKEKGQDGNPTKDAHYKFLKIRDAPKSND